MIRALIFDLGGVIIRHAHNLMPSIISAVFDLSAVRGREIWHEHKDALLTGELPSVAFLEKIKQEIGTTEPIDILLDRWKTLYENDAAEVNTGLLDSIRRLRKTYPVYLLTDTIEVHHEFNEARGLYAHFDGVFSSHIEGKSKSQGKDVFVTFLNKFHLQADSCVFIDDMEAYVVLAKSSDIHGFVYTTVAQFKKDLHSIGVTW